MSAPGYGLWAAGAPLPSVSPGQGWPQKRRGSAWTSTPSPALDQPWGSKGRVLSTGGGRHQDTEALKCDW